MTTRRDLIRTAVLSATLATAGFVFLIGFFGAGLATGLLTRRMWK